MSIHNQMDRINIQTNSSLYDRTTKMKFEYEREKKKNKKKINFNFPLT